MIKENQNKNHIGYDTIFFVLKFLDLFNKKTRYFYLVYTHNW